MAKIALTTGSFEHYGGVCEARTEELSLERIRINTSKLLVEVRKFM